MLCEYRFPVHHDKYNKIIEKDTNTRRRRLYLNEGDDVLTDAILDKVLPDTTHLIVCRPQSCHNTPVRIECSPEKLGSLNLLGIDFQCTITGLDSDSVFQYCKCLEYIGLGTHVGMIFSSIQFLPNLPLKALAFNGRFFVSISDVFHKFTLDIQPAVNIQIW
jgi:hypothetical protein